MISIRLSLSFLVFNEILHMVSIHGLFIDKIYEFVF
jgi:hypothetical protein